MRYNLRDARGKFTKVETIDWSMEKQAMTIDNESGEQVRVVEDIPTQLPITGEESVIRNSVMKLADYFVALSSWSKKFEEAEQKMKSLTTALDDAVERARFAEDECKKFYANMQEAQANEKMAREAYTVVAKERDQLSDKLGMYKVEIEDLKMESSARLAHIEIVEQARDEKGRLLDTAREERDRFRDEAENLRIAVEAAQHEHDQQMATANQTVQDLRRELDGFHHKANGLEAEAARLGVELDKHKATIQAMRGLIN